MKSNELFVAAQFRHKRLQDLPSVLTVKQVAWVLDTNAQTVSRMCKEGRLPAFKVGKNWRLNRDALIEKLGGNVA